MAGINDCPCVTNAVAMGFPVSPQLLSGEIVLESAGWILLDPDPCIHGTPRNRHEQCVWLSCQSISTINY